MELRSRGPEHETAERLAGKLTQVLGDFRVMDHAGGALHENSIPQLVDHVAGTAFDSSCARHSFGGTLRPLDADERHRLADAHCISTGSGRQCLVGRQPATRPIIAFARAL